MSGTALAPIFLTGTAPLCFIDMNWLILLAAGFFEIIWALGLKYADGFTKFWPSVFTLVATTISFVLVSFAMRTIPVGTAYAVWTGIGVLGAATFGIILSQIILAFWSYGISIFLWISIIMLIFRTIASFSSKGLTWF